MGAHTHQTPVSPMPVLTSLAPMSSRPRPRTWLQAQQFRRAEPGAGCPGRCARNTTPSLDLRITLPPSFQANDLLSSQVPTILALGSCYPSSVSVTCSLAVQLFCYFIECIGVPLANEITRVSGVQFCNACPACYSVSRPVRQPESRPLPSPRPPPTATRPAPFPSGHCRAAVRVCGSRLWPGWGGRSVLANSPPRTRPPEQPSVPAAAPRQLRLRPLLCGRGHMSATRSPP